MFPMTDTLGVAPPRLEQLLEVVTDGVLALDVQGRSTWLNTSAERLLGRSRGELLGHVLWAELPGLEETELGRACRRALADGQSATVEEHLASLGAWLEARVFPTAEGLLVLLRDVTPLKQLAEDLGRSEARFRSLVVATSTILWTTDATGVFQEDSPTWCAFTGQSTEQWRNGSGWLEAIHPEDRGRASAAWKRAFATRGLYEVEYRLRRQDGTYTPVVSRGVPVLELDGSVREWVGSITDITAQRRARQALELISEATAALASTLELRQALERLTRCLVPRFAEWCGVYLRHGEGPLERVAFTDVDPVRALQLRKAGRRPGDTPLGPRTVLASGRPESFPALTEEALAGELDESRRELLRAYVGLRGLCVPISLDGRTLGVLSLSAGDGYRAYDADDIRVAEELAHRIAISVEHAWLFEMARQERDRAEEANRAKDEFLATVSHELRTPLTAILGWSRILRTTPLPPEKQERALETVERSAKAQAQIVDDLLDISRIVAGRMRLEVQPVELLPVVEAALEAVRPAAVARDIRIEPELETGAGAVQGDANRLQQVAWNLLTNAIKFTPEGGRVTVRLRRVESLVELEVMDSGQGIAPAFLPHVFERFRQADGSATRRYGGLGLGLAIVRHLVELHGGTVHAHSEGEGHGARFTVRLPLSGTRATGASSSRATPSLLETPLPEELPDLSGVHVLVVDDEVNTRELLRVVLEERGAQVTVAASAAEAFECLMRAPPDMLVSDIGMPGEDGYALIRRVRALRPEQGGQVPAAALTAFTRLEDRTRALVAGFQVHVPKPVEPAELVMAIANQVNRFSPR